MNYYHRAIYGLWPEKPEPNRIQTRIELVETLGKSGRKTQAQAELLSLMTEIPDDVAVKKQLGRFLLDYDLPKEAAQVFQEVVRKAPHDGDAYAGLGRAEFEQDDFRSAQQAFKNALRWNPGDMTSKKQFELTEQILALDPSVHGLNAMERYARSRKLIEATLGALDQCVATATGQLPPSATELADSARKLLLHRGRPRSYSDATEANLALAEELWKTRIDACGLPKPSDEMLSILMARLPK